MNIKLKGSRLEAEIDKARGECNWARLTELLPSIRSKNGGIDHLTSLIEGELYLEGFLEKERENCTPQKHYYDFLRDSENLLQNAATINKEETTIVMEAYILLAKLHFFCAEYAEALQDIEKSKIDAARTQFITLRSLKLAAESYAIKGFSLEHINHKERQSKPVHNSHDLSRKRILSCFETSVELSISYISELQKSINSKPRGASTSTTLIGYSTKNLKIGLLLEMALERAPYLSLRKSVSDRRWDLDGIEWYRRIMTELSDKSMVDKVQQKLCRQLAEVLMRGMLESGYDFSSRAINSKSKSLSFYTGSNTNYFAPQSRFEEVILLLLISEIIASQLMRINRAEGMRSENGDQHSEVSIGEKTMSINNLKMVHNLLVLVLSNLRQYHLLASIFERSMDFAQEDRYMHLQFSLALICDNRFVRALKTLQHCPSVGPENGPQKEKYILQHMFAARLQIEQLGDANAALESATKAVISSQDFWLAGRCNLLYAFALSMKAESETCFATKKSLMQESIQSYEKALELDPHDDLAHFFCGLEYSLVRNLDMAQERCQDSLDINLENPSAVMLMALLFTAKKDYKSALELVINSLLDFPSHYGLLVLRLKLEAKYGRIEEALQTSKSLLSFWRKVSLPADCTFDEEASHHNGFSGDSLRAKPSTLTTKMNSKEALVPVTPMFTAPLGISTTTLAVTPSLGASNLDIAETNSMLGQTTTNLSEYGGAASTVSDSMMISSSSNPGLPFSAFRVQANIWVELAEFFLEVDRASDIQACVEEVCSVYPNSHQALYLKGRLFLIRAEKCMDTNAALSKRLKVEAKSCFLGALSIFPAHIPSLTFLSKLYILEHNLKMAEKMMRDVIAIDPLQQKCWHSLGRILAEEQRIEEANECFQTAGSLNFSTPLIPFSVIPRVMKGL